MYDSDPRVGWRGTAYGVVQAVSTWELWDAPRRSSRRGKGRRPSSQTATSWMAVAARRRRRRGTNSWNITNTVAAVPNTVGPAPHIPLDHEASIIGWESNTFGKYPWSTAGGVGRQRATVRVRTGEPDAPDLFAGLLLRAVNGDSVVVHELAHQWFGDKVAVARWQDIWLNEGFATYAEWLWAEHEGRRRRRRTSKPPTMPFLPTTRSGTS